MKTINDFLAVYSDYVSGIEFYFEEYADGVFIYSNDKELHGFFIDVVPKQNVRLLATETLESLKDKVDVFKVCGELYKFGYETVKFYGTEWSY